MNENGQNQAMTTAPLIHIGYHRTATTWFQDQFYPAVRNAVFVPRALARDVLIAPNAFSFSPQQAREQLADYGDGRRLLICEENLSGYIHNGGLGGLVSREMAGRLRESFPDAQIVVVLRSQVDIITATYAQYVKGGGTHDIDRYLGGQDRRKGASKYWYKAPLFSFDHFNYRPLLEYYRSLFGMAQVSVRLYEQFAEDQRQFLIDFARDMKLDVDVNDLDVGRVNASRSARQLEILRRLNLLTSRSVLDKRTLMNVDEWYERRWTWLRRIDRLLPSKATLDRNVVLTETKRAMINDRYRADNKAIASEWNLPLGEYGYSL